MDNIDWDQLACLAAERDLAAVVASIAARYPSHRAGGMNDCAAVPLTWRTLMEIADEAESDIGLQARHERWVLARVLRLPGDEALRRAGELPALDAPVDLHWPDAMPPAVFRAVLQAFGMQDVRPARGSVVGDDDATADGPSDVTKGTDAMDGSVERAGAVAAANVVAAGDDDATPGATASVASERVRVRSSAGSMHATSAPMLPAGH